MKPPETSELYNLAISLDGENIVVIEFDGSGFNWYGKSGLDLKINKIDEEIYKKFEKENSSVDK